MPARRSECRPSQSPIPLPTCAEGADGSEGANCCDRRAPSFSAGQATPDAHHNTFHESVHLRALGRHDIQQRHSQVLYSACGSVPASPSFTCAGFSISSLSCAGFSFPFPLLFLHVFSLRLYFRFSVHASLRPGQQGSAPAARLRALAAVNVNMNSSFCSMFFVVCRSAEWSPADAARSTSRLRPVSASSSEGGLLKTRLRRTHSGQSWRLCHGQYTSESSSFNHRRLPLGQFSRSAWRAPGPRVSAGARPFCADRW